MSDLLTEKDGQRLSWAARIGFFLGPIVGILVAAITPTQFRALDGTVHELDFAGQATIAMAVWMAIWWLTETVNITVTALLPLVLFPILGIAEIGQTAAPYANPIIFLFLGGLLLARAMQEWGLGERIAICILSLVGSRPPWILAAFMLVTALFSAFVSNTATTAMMLPIGLNVIRLIQKQLGGADRAEELRRFSVAMMLGIAYAASIGGMATMIGSPPNAIMVAEIGQIAKGKWDANIDFLTWMKIAVPVVLVMLPITWFMLARLFYSLSMRPIAGAQDQIRVELRRLGRVRTAEIFIFIVFMAAVALWVARPWISRLEFPFGEQTEFWRPFAGLDDTVIAMGAGLVLFLLPAGSGSRRFILDWRSTANLPWGTLLLFGGGLSLAAAIENNQVAAMLGAQAGNIPGIAPWLAVLTVGAVVVFSGELTSNTAAAAIAIPILAAIAPSLNLHPLELIFPATLACSCGFMLPVATPPNALVFASGYVPMREMIRVGFWLDLTSIAIVSLAGFVLVRTII
jgi:sodium-dependent dicarboxylate transporter 2/3/5